MRHCNAVIAEDEPVLRAELRELLGRTWPELTISGEAQDGLDALRLLEEHAPDVVFLDIEMPGMNGLDVARYASGRCHVVFVTAYDSYALGAFELGAVDYVMKPLTEARLASTVRRLRERIDTVPADLGRLLAALEASQPRPREFLRWITVEHGDDLRLITIDSVCYFQADNKYTRIVMADSESLIRWPIKRLCEEVDPAVFWQIHRGTLLNVNAVAGVTRDIKGNLRVKLTSRRETLPVSEPYVHRFRLM
jgi:DNA-binding LytR/AlgR family response regulator